VNDHQFRIRTEARNAIARLVKDAGGQMVPRPLMRSEPGGPTAQEPEPLAGITAAAALEREARRRCLDSIRYAREDGLTWREIGLALSFTADPGPAVRAYEYANPGPEYAGWFTWSCPACGKLIRDHGPETGPRDAEEGHAEGCTRLAGAVRAWDAQWEEDTS
jgi:hypothetical protein